MLFNKKPKETAKDIKPQERGFYAWNNIHAGSFLVYVGTAETYYDFVFLPGPSKMRLAFETFSGCIKTNTLEFVEQLPQDIFEETIALSEKNNT